MTPTSQSRIRLFGAWCGPLYMIGLLLGWGLFAGFLPPIPPATGADEVAKIFSENTTGIRVGMVLVMYTALIFIPFGAVMAYFLKRIEGGAGVLTYTALLGAAGNMVLTFYPAVWWLTAAYRPERAPELIYSLHDMSWLQFIGGVSMYDAMPLAIAIAAFCDDSPNPVFPRWFGFFNIMAVLIILPDQLLFFFHSGPFAWNGLFGLWIPLTVLGLWYLVTFWLMRKAILRERQQAASLTNRYGSTPQSVGA